MTGEVQVAVYYLADDEVAVTAAYHESSARMAGTTGLLRDELHRGVTDERSFAVVSRWSGWAAFAAWEASPGHQDQTAPLRQFRDRTRARPFEIFQVAAGYEAGRTTTGAPTGSGTPATSDRSRRRRAVAGERLP